MGFQTCIVFSLYETYALDWLLVRCRRDLLGVWVPEYVLDAVEPMLFVGCFEGVAEFEPSVELGGLQTLFRVER